MTGPALTRAEIDQLRDATPGTQHVVHLNHAGSSLPPQSVLDAQLGHLRLEAEIGGYEAAAAATEHETAVYRSLETLIGAAEGTVARAEHATAAWNAGFWAVPMQPGQRIVTARAAYGANAVAFLRAVERRGVRIEVVDDDEYGQVDLAALDATMDDDVALVALTHVPTNGGLVNPAADVGRIAKAHGAPFLLDACQSIGQLDLDVADLNCDLLSATGRKYLRGPRGTGFLYASPAIIDTLHPDHPDHHGSSWTDSYSYTLRDDARRFEHWEFSHAGWLGLGAAADLAIELGTDRIETTVTSLADRFRDRLRDAGHPVADKGASRCGIVTLELGNQADALKAHLAGAGINVSVSSPDSTRWDAEERDLDMLVRLSVHYLTTDAEIDATLDALAAFSEAR